LLTLYITPVYYVYIEQARKALVRKRAQAPHAEPQPVAAMQGVAKHRPV
jgi:hypothetical protein